MKIMEKFKNRLKSITTEGLVVIIVSFFTLLFAVSFVQALIKSLISKEYMFDATKPDNDIIMLVFFSFLLAIVLLVIVYNLFFRKFEKIQPVTKDIEKGQIVIRKNGRDEKIGDVIKKHDNPVDTATATIDKEKFKKNLDNHDKNKE